MRDTAVSLPPSAILTQAQHRPDRQMRLQAFITMLLAAHVAALQPAVRSMRAPAAIHSRARAAPVQMSDAKGPKEWFFIKGNDAAGKEQTYMYLGPKAGASPDSNPIAELLGIEDSPFAFMVDIYFILLFTPFVFALGYFATGFVTFR